MPSWLGSFSFANPAFLIGGLAGLIPIVIHLIYTRKAPQILFSTVRFLKIAARKTARRRRVEDMLLLVVRVLLFSLLAGALAQPFFRSGGIFGANAGVTAAIVLDNSMSMATEQEGQSRYAKAKELTQGIIRSLPSGSAVAVIYSYAPHHKTEPAEGQAKGAASPASLGEGLSHDIQSVYEAVSAGDASAGRGDMAAAVKKAYEFMAKVTAPNREIYVITDMQKMAWEGAAEKLGDETTKDIPVFAVNCSTGSFRNVAVSQVEIKARAAVIGAPVNIDATIINSSNMTQKDVSAALYVDRSKRAQKVYTIPAQGSVAASFGYVFDASGEHTGWADAEVRDSLPMDNKRNFCISITDRIPVAIVTESESALPFMSESFYLTRALNPFHGTKEEDKGAVAIHDLSRSALSKTDLDAFRILFLLNLKELTQAEADRLRRYLAGGGNVVIFPGDQANVKAYERLETGDPPLLPARVMKLAGDAEDRSRYMPLSRLDTSHPIFRPLADMPNTAIRSVHLYRYLDLQVRPGTPGRVLAKLGDGKPFLVEGSVGAGKVLLFCVSAGAAWSNLPVRNLFLPMVQQVVYCLAGRVERRSDYVVGSPVEIMPRVTGKTFVLTVTDPLGQTKRVEPSARGGQVLFVYADTDSLGDYSWETDEKPPQRGIFVVNPDAQESDLTEYRQEELAGLFFSTRVQFAGDMPQLEKAVMNLRQGFQLWNYLLLVVLAIAIAECVLANMKKGAAQAPGGALAPVPGR